MQEVEFVRDLDIFFEKAEYGINHTYQLHRELGCVFIEASFQGLQDEEGPQPLFKTKIEIAPPKYVGGCFTWDSNGFPYEVENYLINDKEVAVPLYRPLDVGWRRFLLDTAEDLQDMILDNTIRSDQFSLPVSLVEGLRKVAKNIQEITTFLEQKRRHLDSNEQSAIDRHFGECSIWERLEDDMAPALATFIGDAISAQRELYEKIQKEQTEQRHKIFIEADNEAMNRLENVLKQHNFKKGYVS
jgi:hypothetical protein